MLFSSGIASHQTLLSYVLQSAAVFVEQVKLHEYTLRRYHTERIARAGYIGIALSQSPEMVAPHGASEPIFGTNPIAISIPTGEGRDPITFDMATSAMAW